MLNSNISTEISHSASNLSYLLSKLEQLFIIFVLRLTLKIKIPIMITVSKVEDKMESTFVLRLPSANYVWFSFNTSNIISLHNTIKLLRFSTNPLKY